MRVLLLTQYYPPEVGAAQARLCAFARELKRHGHEVEVVTAMPNYLAGRTYDGYRGRFYVRESIDGITVHRTWVYAATGTGIRRVLNYLSFTLSCLFGIVRSHRPDAVFVESPPLTLGAAGWIAARFARAALIFNVSDLWPDSARDLGVIGDGAVFRAALRLEAWTYERAAVVNAVTKGIAQTLEGRKRVPAQKLRFLPNGVDLSLFSPRAPDESLRTSLRLDKPVLLYAGTHGIVAGLEHVLEAAALLSSDAIVVFVGSGPAKKALVERTRALRIENVRFVDPVPLDRMPAFYSIARAAIVSVLPSPVTQGTRPAKLFPAFASGVPILYMGEGEGAEIVRGAGAGIVVPPRDSAGIARAARTLIADENLHRTAAANARRIAVEEYGWPTIVERWLQSIGARSVYTA
jgi:colanic acid biosynthesis glycosyl transferase WcaI